MESAICGNIGEVENLCNNLVERQMLQNVSVNNYRIIDKGYLWLEEQEKNHDSKQGFVAMWFNDKMKSAYDKAIKPAIEKAKYTTFRIDNKEHVNKIDDEIIAEIKRSRFLVADFTGHRGGVYFEAGFAMGLGIPVIWTCKEGDFKDLHFDIRQYNCIKWKDEEDLEKKLYQRIRAVV